jgi:hypothetical protein
LIILYIAHIFMRHDGRRKFNYTHFCVSKYLRFFYCSIFVWCRAITNIISLWKISRTWKSSGWETCRLISLMITVDTFDQVDSSSFKLAYLRIHFPLLCIYLLLTKTRSGNSNRNSKSSLQANFIRREGTRDGRFPI